MKGEPALYCNPKVSVVLPTYNDVCFLPTAINSILAQTWVDYELIVVNDGSTDDTASLLEKYEADPRVKVIHKQNERLPRALNTGFEAASGDYLTWTSSDNVLLPQMLERLAATLDARPDVGLVYADWQVIDDAGQVVGMVQTLDYDQCLLRRVNYVNACFMYRRECQEAVGLYDPEYILMEDWEYWWRISQHFPLMRVPEVLYQYRQHASSLTNVHVKNRVVPSYQRLLAAFRRDPLRWYYSKLKWELLRWRRKARNPLEAIPQN